MSETTFRYRNASSRTLVIYRLGVTVAPGDEFSSPSPIDNADFELVTAPATPAAKKKDAGAAGKED